MVANENLLLLTVSEPAEQLASEENRRASYPSFITAFVQCRQSQTNSKHHVPPCKTKRRRQHNINAEFSMVAAGRSHASRPTEPEAFAGTSAVSAPRRALQVACCCWHRLLASQTRRKAVWAGWAADLKSAIRRDKSSVAAPPSELERGR